MRRKLNNAPIVMFYMATYEDFLELDLRVGKIIKVEDFPAAKKPTYKVQVDFGSEIGIKWSSVQAKKEHTKKELKEHNGIQF